MIKVEAITVIEETDHVQEPNRVQDQDLVREDEAIDMIDTVDDDHTLDRNQEVDLALVAEVEAEVETETQVAEATDPQDVIIVQELSRTLDQDLEAGEVEVEIGTTITEEALCRQKVETIEAVQIEVDLQN